MRSILLRDISTVFFSSSLCEDFFLDREGQGIVNEGSTRLGSRWNSPCSRGFFP